jgi:hypothetical protein
VPGLAASYAEDLTRRLQARRFLKFKRKEVAAAGAPRGDGECVQMNATATMAPAGPQYMRALERANQVRLARAELKRRVAIGEIDAAEVILACPWEAESMAVMDLLMSQRRWGQTRCRKFLAQIPMSEKKTIGSMTERQQRTLAAMLTSVERGHAWSAAPWLTDSLTRA